MSPVFPTAGSFPLTSVAKLPNVTVAFPGEHWSNRIAQAAIVPGEACVPVNISGKLGVRRAVAADLGNPRMGIALRTIDTPDGASDSIYTQSLGPNEIKNRQINTGEYVHVYHSGAFHLTLVVPRAWVPSDLVGWNDAGARPTGKTGVGAWDVVTPANQANALFEVMEFRPFSANGQEGILTVRSLRGQF
jgi:hypothetical protein